MEFVIQYEHIEEDLVTSDEEKRQFDKVKECANKYSLELTDKEFVLFLKIHKSGKDIDWLMHQMSIYKLSFTDALASYITY